MCHIKMTSIEITIGTGYMETTSGKCKIFGIISSLLATLLVSFSFSGKLITTFQFGVITTSVISLILLVFYISTLVEKIHIQWNKYQMYIYTCGGIFHGVVSILMWCYGWRYGKLIAAGGFGFVSAAAQIIDAFNNYKKITGRK